MSMLSPAIQNALTLLLQALSSPDNAIRSRAEEQLNSDWVAAQPDVLLMGLVEQIQHSADPSVREDACASFLGILQHVTDVYPALTVFLDSVLRSSSLPAYIDQGEKNTRG